MTRFYATPALAGLAALLAVGSAHATDTGMTQIQQTMAQAQQTMTDQDTIPLPQAQQSNAITYITGGIGDEEREALKSVRSDYNLHVISAVKDGAFEGDSTIAIFNRKGEEMLQTTMGPLFYAKLPPGSYTLVARNENEQLRKQFTMSGKPVDVAFYW